MVLSIPMTSGYSHTVIFIMTLLQQVGISLEFSPQRI